MKKILFLCLFAFTAKAQVPKPVITVYGTSIEYGVGCSNYNTDPWPTKFSAKLGWKYAVKAYGVIGASYCQSNNQVVINKAQVQEAKIVVFGGPTNDAAWSNSAQANLNFKTRYQRNIDSVKAWNPSATIYCITAIKVGPNPHISQSQIDLRNEQVRFLADINNLTVWSADQLPLIVGPDGIHSTTAGYDLLATFLVKEFTHQTFTDKPIDVEEPMVSERVVPIPSYPLDLIISGNKRYLRHK